MSAFDTFLGTRRKVTDLRTQLPDEFDSETPIEGYLYTVPGIKYPFYLEIAGSPNCPVYDGGVAGHWNDLTVAEKALFEFAVDNN